MDGCRRRLAYSSRLGYSHQSALIRYMLEYRTIELTGVYFFVIELCEKGVELWGCGRWRL